MSEKSGHGRTVCICGKVLLSCRCPGPHQDTVSPMPCRCAKSATETMLRMKQDDELKLCKEIDGLKADLAAKDREIAALKSDAEVQALALAAVGAELKQCLEQNHKIAEMRIEDCERAEKAEAREARLRRGWMNIRQHGSDGDQAVPCCDKHYDEMDAAHGGTKIMVTNQEGRNMPKDKPGPSPENAAWAIVDPATDPVAWFAEHLKCGSGDIHCVWLPDHPETKGGHPCPDHAVLLAIVGNGPRSEANAKEIVELWNKRADPGRELEMAVVEAARETVKAAREFNTTIPGEWPRAKFVPVGLMDALAALDKHRGKA